jgi:RNA methyltransferase, TrmH family
MTFEVITSRDNPLVKKLRALSQEALAYRKHGQVWLEGDHLCRAMLTRGRLPSLVVMAASGAVDVSQWGVPASVKVVRVADAIMAQLSSLESPAAVAFVLDLNSAAYIRLQAPTVVLDRLQDPGNVGSILRSAAAFGFEQVLALKGTAGLWAPKVVRAGMGAHFGLNLVEGLDVAAVQALQLPLLGTSSHQGSYLHQTRLPWPCAWLMGHEGQGVSQNLFALSEQVVRIAQPGGEESLNVAAAAAICLHASAAARVL